MKMTDAAAKEIYIWFTYRRIDNGGFPHDICCFWRYFITATDRNNITKARRQFSGPWERERPRRLLVIGVDVAAALVFALVALVFEVPVRAILLTSEENLRWRAAVKYRQDEQEDS